MTQKAKISNEIHIKEIQFDCDGNYTRLIKRGDIEYTCCSFTDIKASTHYIGNGDGDKCPKCGANIVFTRAK